MSHALLLCNAIVARRRDQICTPACMQSRIYKRLPRYLLRGSRSPSLSPASRLDPAPSLASQIPGVIHFARITPITSPFFHFFENGTRQRILYARPLQRLCTAPSKKKCRFRYCISAKHSPNGDDSYAAKNKTRKSEKYVLYYNKVSYKKLRDRTVKSNSYQTRKTLM